MSITFLMKNKDVQPRNLAHKLFEHFHFLLENLPELPKGVSWLLPFKELPETAKVTKAFLEKFYGDYQNRTLILGINPGRFVAGVSRFS